MRLNETATEGGRNALGWILVVLLFIPWLVIQLAAWITRLWAQWRGGID